MRDQVYRSADVRRALELPNFKEYVRQELKKVVPTTVTQVTDQHVRTLYDQLNKSTAAVEGASALVTLSQQPATPDQTTAVDYANTVWKEFGRTIGLDARQQELWKTHVDQRIQPLPNNVQIRGIHRPKATRTTTKHRTLHLPPPSNGGGPS